MPPENLVVGKQYIMVFVRGGGHRVIIEFREFYNYDVGDLWVLYTTIADFRDLNGERTEVPQYIGRPRRFGIAAENARFYEIE